MEEGKTFARLSSTAWSGLEVAIPRKETNSPATVLLLHMLSRAAQKRIPLPRLQRTARARWSSILSYTLVICPS